MQHQTVKLAVACPVLRTFSTYDRYKRRGSSGHKCVIRFLNCDKSREGSFSWGDLDIAN